MAPRNGLLICHVDEAVDPLPALRVAEVLGARLGHDLLLAVAGCDGSPDPTLPEAVRRRLIRSHGPMPRIERVAPGDTGMGLAALAERERARFLVVASGHHSARLGSLLGRPHSKLGAVGPCPVVVVPEDLGEDHRPGGPIVCGVDGSDEALGAVRIASRMAGELGTGLVLVTVASVPGAGPVTSGSAAPDTLLLGAEVRSSRRVLERALLDVPSGLEADLSIQLGDPAEQLVDVATSCGAELMVVGARGVGRLRPAGLGSVSAELVAWAPVPVVIVPPSLRRHAAPLLGVPGIALPAAEPALVPLALRAGEQAMVLLGLAFVLVLLLLIVLTLLGRLGEGDRHD